MLIVRGIMWISVLIVMLICMVKTKRNGMKKKIRALIFVVFLFILFVFMPYSTEAPIENLFITFKTPEQAIHYINAPFSNDKIEDWMGRFVQKSLHAAASGYEKEKIYIMCY